MTNDLQLVDDYLAQWDRFAQGENSLVPILRENQGSFEAALARLLVAEDNRAPARMVFYPVVQVGGAIPVDSELGRACGQIVGREVPVRKFKENRHIYFCGDLFFWWLDHRHDYDAFALFDQWLQRDFAQTVVIPMYKSACKQ